jgi:hypothetical protein
MRELSMTMRQHSSLGNDLAPHEEQERSLHGGDLVNAMDYARRFGGVGNMVDQTINYL